MREAELRAGGWAPLSATHFNAAAGPFWLRREADGSPLLALPTEERHSNGHLGIVHGGVLMTLADIALGVVVDALGAPMCATSQLSVSFAGAARIGELVVCRPELIRKTSALVFVRGVLSVGERVIGSADGVFSVLDATKVARARGADPPG